MESNVTKMVNRRALIGGVCVGLGIVLGGCVSPQYNYRPKAVDISDPPLNAVVIRSVGEPMLRQGTFVEHDGIQLSEPIKVGSLGNYTFSTGHYLKHGESSAGKFYKPSNELGSGSVKAGGLADPFQTILIQAEDGKICGVTVFNAKTCTDAVGVREVKVPIASADAFQQTLLYSGKVGNKISISYRESSGSMARPAFNHDAEYDLTESNVIGYRGATLEVIEANNQEIRYRVLRNFNAATP